MQKLKTFIFFIFLTIHGYSQAQDTSKILNAEHVLEIVRQFHPVAKQANIGIERAKAEQTTARSLFDPILSNYSSKKTFDGTNYYNYQITELKIPTWYGLELYGGMENLNGDRFDPSETVGKTSYWGVNFSLAKNLLMDKRRATLQQAKIYINVAKTEQQVIINDLLMDAIESYWYWVKSYQTYLVVSNNVNICEVRLEYIKKSFIHGDRPAIDTLEALTQLQSFQYQKNVYWLEFQNAGIKLSAYLWTTNVEPFQLPETIIPADGWEDETIISKFNISLSDLLNLSKSYNPNLLIYPYKIDLLKIEKKLKFQDLLPRIDLRYNKLGKGYEFPNSNTILQNNYQYGLKMEMPIFLSQGRGGYKTTKLKIEVTKLEQNQKNLQVELKIRSYFNEFIYLKKQIELQTNNYNSYKLLVKAEESKLYQGESSLFIVNGRENKALEALEKLIELKTKYFKTLYALQWSAGLLK